MLTLRPRPALTFALLLTLLSTLACAGRKGPGPRYRPADELQECYPGECVEARLSFRHWANAAYYKGRMVYHCDPGSELDGPPDPGVTRMIFAVHGVVGPYPERLERLSVPPGLAQFRHIVNGLRRAQTLDHTLEAERIAIIAPSFQRTEQWQPYTDEDPRVWTWKRSTWNHGTDAKHNETKVGIVKAESVSSFDVFDEFMRAAVIKFPNLEQIVIVGHSSGGQAVHRYAMLGVGVHEHLEAEGIAVRYMPANPGSYAFPMMLRKLPPGRSSVPPGEGPGDTGDWHWATAKGCENYDAWPYGLGRLAKADGDRAVRAANYAIDQYLRPVDRKLARKAGKDPTTRAWAKAARVALRLQYASREVWHIQAATDTASTFPENCRATSEGRSRFERFSNVQELWTTKVGIATPNLHFVALEGTHPHSSKAVYASDAAIHLLFH